MLLELSRQNAVKTLPLDDEVGFLFVRLFVCLPIENDHSVYEMIISMTSKTLLALFC